MKIKLNESNIRAIVITAIITFIITVCIVLTVAWKGINIFVDRTIDNITGEITEMCLNDPLIYRGRVYFPPNLEGLRRDGKLYQKDLATILWDLGGAVGSSNCKETIPIPEPFDKYWIAEGTDHQDNKTMYGYIFHSKNLRLACFVFAGTYHGYQWRNNLKVNLTRADGLERVLPDVQVHSGFYSSYMSVKPALWEWWDNHGHEVEKLIITGRSLGGALSTIAAYDFALIPDIKLLHYSFASPRVGNVTFADSFNERVPYSVRVFNTEDIVVDLPPAIFRSNVYKHTGDPWTNKVFTKNIETLIGNHIEAYWDLPI